MDRKKKCDENRPRCSDCRRLNLPCQWTTSATADSVDIDDTSSPKSYATVSADDNQVDDVDDSLNFTSLTPDNDEDFIATLFPHPLPKPNAAVLPLDPLNVSTNPHLHSEEDRFLYNHYIHVVARALSRSHDSDRNPFLVTLLPLATTSDTVTSVILSLSGCHWKRVYPSIWRCALSRQGQGSIPAQLARLR